MKKNKLFKIIPFISAISIMAIGCGSNNPNDNILEDVVPSSDSTNYYII